MFSLHGEGLQVLSLCDSHGPLSGVGVVVTVPEQVKLGRELAQIPLGLGLLNLTSSSVWWHGPLSPQVGSEKFTHVRSEEKKTTCVFVLYTARKLWAKAVSDHGDFYLKAVLYN